MDISNTERRGAVGSASDYVTREFEPHQRLLLFPSARDFTLIA